AARHPAVRRAHRRGRADGPGHEGIGRRRSGPHRGRRRRSRRSGPPAGPAPGATRARSGAGIRVTHTATPLKAPASAWGPAFFTYEARMATTTITADQVKKLRDQTGAGMMDCKAALTEANGNVEEATTILRKKGLASAAKKAGRATSEGLIGSRLSRDRSTGILVEVNCESDFVARTPDFQQLIADVLDEIEKAGDGATEAWLKDLTGPVQKRVAATIGKLGENMAVPRSVRYSGGATSLSTSTPWAA